MKTFFISTALWWHAASAATRTMIKQGGLVLEFGDLRVLSPATDDHQLIAKKVIMRRLRQKQIVLAEDKKDASIDVRAQKLVKPKAVVATTNVGTEALPVARSKKVGAAAAAAAALPNTIYKNKLPLAAAVPVNVYKNKSTTAKKTKKAATDPDAFDDKDVHWFEGHGCEHYSMSLPTTTAAPTSTPTCGLPTSPPTALLPTAKPSSNNGATLTPTTSSRPTTAVPSSGPNSSTFVPTILNTGSTSIPTPSSQSETPSDVPSQVPTTVPLVEASMTPSVSPTSSISGASASPTSIAAQNELIFNCTNDGVDLINTPAPGSVGNSPTVLATIARTSVNISVTYLVESFVLLSSFKDALERLLLEYAVVGALQCDEGGPLFNDTLIADFLVQQVGISTAPTGESCISTVSICTVLQSNFTFLVAGSTDPDVAALLAYQYLEQKLSSSTFVNDIPALSRTAYMRPLLLLPGSAASSVGTNTPNVSASATELSVSPWTLGAVLAMSMGGVAALWAWGRNRQTRHRRHMQLLEDMSDTSTHNVDPRTGAFPQDVGDRSEL